MTRLTERFWEDYALGEQGGGGSRTLDQSDVNTFAGLTQDFHPAHMDRAFAEERFGGRLVHGALTFGLVVGLTVEYNPRAVAYGYERIRFPKPVMAGDTVTATSVVVDIAEHRSPKIGLVTKEYTGVNQRGETVLFCRHILAVDRRA
ncbi:MaoC family dehydratase [Streptomyces sp. ITFR-6]|uniref:MaoC family dehydratase n=1 Tax=Streptomyces sp. ITFR-6 TaxID=3075197 RepID=UPI002889C25E|nr:MaoC family dehydratase [Streptomyces sp. ITFR-6]WNI34504.1 MaoC family dehydratase [Streptomyces sp. ITFR-6]